MKWGGAQLYEPITIGKHDWIASETMVLKGSHISDGSVIAAHAIVTKGFYEPALLIGNCNLILRKNVTWKR